MNNFASAALLAHANGTNNSGFIALAIVQLLAVVLALGLTFYTQDAYPCRIPAAWDSWIHKVVWAVGVLTVLVAACQEDCAPKLWLILQGTPPGPAFLRWFDLGTAHLIYFLADFAALAFLIYATGGPQQSLYATFLFVIVPISIALGQPGPFTVIVFAGITLTIFITLLCVKPPHYFRGADTETRARKQWLGLITAACVLFPTLVFCVRSWAPADTLAKAAQQQSGVATTMTSPGEPEDVATP